jgi:NAD(P)-dependent dehydrogenase (short-subunit alcohol dehydrogenase family)
MMSNLFDLSNDVAVVIGATGVLGGALAEGLAAAGAKVAVLGRSAERGELASGLFARRAARRTFSPANALERSSLSEAHAAITGEFGVPTILVNAAGGNDPASHR